jgi:predicted RNA-binding Zn ribbon-like protein
MNTVWADRAGVHDALEDAADLRAVLAAVGVDVGRVRIGAAEVGAARRLRDGLRRLAAAVTDDDRPAAATQLTEREAVVAVNAALAAAPVPLLRGHGHEWAFEPVQRHSAAGALGGLAREGAALIADPAHPLRACHAPGCVLYFVRDHPRREWCGVTCGNRARAARHYARVRTQASGR